MQIDIAGVTNAYAARSRISICGAPRNAFRFTPGMNPSAFKLYRISNRSRKYDVVFKMVLRKLTKVMTIIQRYDYSEKPRISE